MSEPSQPPPDPPGGEGLAVVIIDYTNYRGERAQRRIRPHRMWFGEAEWHPGPQWILDAWDLDREAMRSFALADVHGWRPASRAQPST